MPLNTTSIQKGEGAFIYNQYAPLANKPLEVFYYAPQKDLTSLNIVIVMTGINRNADEYRDFWIPLADQYNLLIIAPLFSTEFYPDSRSYNLGNIMDEDEQFIPEEKWSFSIIDPLFEDIKNITQNIHSKYYIFGHSAGAQFVHRFLIFKQSDNIKAAITANAGWYTVPDTEIDFPYGLNKSPVNVLNSISFFDQNLLVLLGEDDNDPESPNLRHTPETELQGPHRFARGFHFFEESQNIAQSLNRPFNWNIETVPNVDHDAEQMSIACARLLFD